MRQAVMKTAAKERYTRDTVIIFAKRSLADSAPQAEATKPGFYREKTQNGLKAWVKNDAGTMTFGCNVDSFQVVVQNLIYERDSIYAAYHKEQIKTQLTHHEKATVKEHRTLGGWLMNNVYWILPLLILVLYAFKTLFKWTL